jgi:hypothetical protein
MVASDAWSIESALSFTSGLGCGRMTGSPLPSSAHLTKRTGPGELGTGQSSGHR